MQEVVMREAVITATTQKRAGIYVRVSSERQGEGVSPGEQERAARARCAAKGWRVAGVYSDTVRFRASTGKLVEPTGTRSDRPAFQAMLADARRGQLDVVVAWREDRLYRGLRPMLDVLDTIQESGLSVELVQENFDPAMAPVKAWVAKMELEGIRQRITMGLHAKARAGRWVGAGVLAYGFRREGDRARERQPVPDEREAEVVRRIYRAYADPEGTRLPLRALAARLNGEGIPTPSARGLWGTATLRRILSSPVYIGQFSWGGHTLFLPQCRIVDEDLWQQAQTALSRNSELASRNRKHAYLLSGYLRCVCGRPMVGTTNGSKSCYYRCSGAWQGTCAEARIGRDWADGIVWEWLQSLVVSDEGIPTPEGIPTLGSEEVLRTMREIEAARLLIDQADRRIERLLDIVDGADEVLAARASARLPAVARQRSALAEEVEALCRDLQAGSPGRRDAQTARELILRLPSAVSDYDAARRALELLGVRVQLVHQESVRTLRVRCPHPPARAE